MRFDTTNSETSRARVVIVGGGISGLAAAERLAAADPAPHVTLVEASSRLGGVIGTDVVDGFVIERGPDVMVAAKPAGRVLCERLGLADRLGGTKARGGYVYSRGRLRRMPLGLTGLLPSRLSAMATCGLFSPLGLLRMATEPLRRSRADLPDESVASFMSRRVGAEVYERLAEPLLTGIYSGQGTRLSMEATFPQLRAMEREHGSLLRGMRAQSARMVAARPASGASHASPFLSFPGGLQELVDALERRLGESEHVTIRLGVAATAIVPASADAPTQVMLATGESIACDAVIVAAPAPVASRLLAPVDAALGSELAAIEHGSTATIAIGVRAADVPRALDASGYVVPRTEGRDVLACTWVSSKHADRAPDGMALFRLFVGGAHRPELVSRSDAELTAIARAELRETLGVTAEPVLVRIGRWQNAMPQYLLGHPERVRRIEAHVAALPWLALAGNAYRGIGVPDCIVSGERAASATLDRLASVGARPDAASATAS